MAYDLHIVRTRDWLEASSAPITKRDIDDLIASDPELEWSASDYVDMSDDSGEVTRYYMIKWRGEPCFWWYRNEVRCSGPDDAQQAKLVQIARALNAYVVGDDGEVYPLDASAEAKPPPATQSWRTARPAFTSWPLWKLLLAGLLLGTLLLALKLQLDRIPMSEARPPKNVKTIQDFENWKGGEIMGTGTFEIASVTYTVMLAPAGRYLASGRSAYLFDEQGRFVDWTPDMGDIYTVENRFNLTSGRVKNITRKQR